MLLVLVLALPIQVKAGPMDAFRANFASIHADLEFTSTAGFIHFPRDGAKRTLLWPEDLAVADDKSKSVIGRWTCDGIAEYYDSRTPNDVVAAAKKAEPKHPEFITGYMPRLRFLCDPQFMITRVQEAPQLAAGLIPPDAKYGAFQMARGPFSWRLDSPFPRWFDANFRGVEPRRKASQLAGRPTEVEVYHKPIGGAWSQVEIHFDPAANYVPRLFRHVYYDPTMPVKLASVAIACVTESRACSSGGVVPTETRVACFSVPDFSTKYPAYDEDTVLVPEDAVELTGFHVTQFADLKGPARFAGTEGVVMISTPGGQTLAPESFNQSPTIATMKGLLGSSINTPPPAPMVVDLAERDRFKAPARRGPWPYLVGGAVVLLVLAFLYRWRRRASLLVLLLAFQCGCGRDSRPIPHLVASFAPAEVVYESNRQQSLTLNLKNDGNCPLLITGVEGGCTCRQIDNSSLPVKLARGKARGLPVKLQPSLNFSRQTFPITVHTDHGEIIAPASVLALPDHYFSPPSFTRDALVDDEAWGFELIYRAIYDPARPDRDGRLVIPAELAMEAIHRKEGKIGDAPDFAFRETTYRVKLKDRTPGLHKAVIGLSRGDRILAEVPVVWRRVSYLSSSPDRVLLGESRASRVFLRCPDEEIELTRVLSAPEGVTAVISSSRELAVRLTPNAPGVIDGAIEVATTARDRPPLRIPVVRYDPRHSG